MNEFKIKGRRRYTHSLLLEKERGRNNVDRSGQEEEEEETKTGPKSSKQIPNISS